MDRSPLTSWSSLNVLGCSTHKLHAHGIYGQHPKGGRLRKVALCFYVVSLCVRERERKREVYICFY